MAIGPILETVDVDSFPDACRIEWILQSAPAAPMPVAATCPLRSACDDALPFGLIKAVHCSRFLMCVRFAIPTAGAPVVDVGMAE